MEVSHTTAAETGRFRDLMRQLYDDGFQVDGELRYDFLWSLCQLERACSALTRFTRDEEAADPAQCEVLQAQADQHCRDARAIIEIAAAERKQRNTRATATSRRYISTRISGALPMQSRASMPA